MGAVEDFTESFTIFVKEVEPRLRHALVASFGQEQGREATAEALAYAWEHWHRVGAMDNSAGYLYRVGRSRGKPERAIRPARRDVEDAEHFARDFDVAADGLMRWMIGKRFVTVIAKAFLEPGHDLSHEHVWFVESDGVIAGMVSGYSAEDHKRSKNGPMFRAAGFGAIRIAAAWVLARRLFAFMDRVPEGDWYLQGLAVDEAFRGAGIGSLLLDHAEEVAATAGAHRLVLDVAVENDAAKRLYERRGMTIDATLPSAPFLGNPVHRMTKAL